MKKVMFLSAMLAGMFFIKPATSDAQINISINFGAPIVKHEVPACGPWGYDDARYYYMPEYDLYYDVLKGEYVWREGNKWISNKVLHNKFRYVDFYNTYKVVLNNNRPWEKHYANHMKYRSYASNHKQVNVLDYRANESGNNTIVYHEPKNERVNDRSVVGTREKVEVRSEIRNTASSRR